NELLGAARLAKAAALQSWFTRRKLTIHVLQMVAAIGVTSALVLQSYPGGNSHLQSVCTQPFEANAVGDGVYGDHVATRSGW
ncbi:hypothetical protein, partial [Luteimonas lutimaris]|uniref:hypothetical protein n=1 Tax=Luteimonas lutimaris TaxID=698645 RepID=UPI0031E23962